MSTNKNPALPNEEGVMSEVELDLMLDTLKWSWQPPLQQDVLLQPQ